MLRSRFKRDGVFVIWRFVELHMLPSESVVAEGGATDNL